MDLDNLLSALIACKPEVRAKIAAGLYDQVDGNDSKMLPVLQKVYDTICKSLVDDVGLEGFERLMDNA